MKSPAAIYTAAVAFVILLVGYPLYLFVHSIAHALIFGSMGGGLK